MHSIPDFFIAGAKLLMAVLLASALIMGMTIVSGLAKDKASDLTKATASLEKSEFNTFNDKDIDGYVLWDELRELSGKRVSGNYFTVRVITGMSDLSWTSDTPIASVFSDQPQAINYLNEEGKYHCELIYSDLSESEIIGIKATQIPN